jgi:3-oxoacyl-[acyl-carrier protein] reductase
VTASSRVAVVSGGSRGLGRALVERLLGEGWRVATFSRGSNDFTAAMADAAGDRFLWRAADLADLGSLQAFLSNVRDQFGHIDLLVNNAAVLHGGLLLTMPSERIAASVNNDLLAPIALTRHCVRIMSRTGRGTIVNVSSINAVRGYRGVAVYSAAKAGLDAFGRSLARELGPLNIRVNSVVPGYFASDMTAGVTTDNRDRILRRTPLGRLATVDDIVGVVLFLTSPAASFITGQTIIVDGGISC